MCTHGGSSFPQVITPFGQGHRGSRPSFRSLVPRSGVSFLVPESRSSFRSLVPRSGVSFLVPESRSSFRSLVPRSGVSFLIPDLTYTFITPSPPSEKEALLTPGIIYTIILFNVGPGNTGPKICNSLTGTSIVGVAQKPKILTTMRRGPSAVCLVRASFLSCVLFLLGNP